METSRNAKAVPISKPLIAELREIVARARGRVAAQVNSELTMMYWHLGERINREILGHRRAEYGKQIVRQVAEALQSEFGGKGFDEKNIRRMMKFAELFPDIKIVATVSRQLGWSHFVEVLAIKDDLQREFYITLAASERWGIRRLRKEINGMMFERMAISQKPDEFIRRELANLRDHDVLSPELVFKSQYFLDFTGLSGMYDERNLEESLLQLDRAGIKVAKYLTELPSRELLMAQVRKSLELARERFGDAGMV